jgi:aspartyl-tRNA(Asn)/glutamyl-tRNA(Gln) amidotransferase subunit B
MSSVTHWEVVIGLEIHTQLQTQSKIFSSSSTKYGADANTQASLVDLAMPGVLPVLNEKAVEFAITFGLAIDAVINQTNVFARKNYFYPDLPKGYQISQMDLPIVGEGSIEITIGDTTKTIGITRAHLEEDAGKSVHNLVEGYSGIDLNRAGTPLLEIVSEPDMRSAKEAVAYAKKIHALVQYIGINDGNLQEGSFRCDANVSIRPSGQQKLGTRTELKNINSFKFLERAINLEIDRQIDVLEEGGRIVQETRLYDEVKDETKSMRSKENANDYRYFPDPDLLPVVISDELLATLKAELPELPEVKKQRYVNELHLSQYDANLLSGDIHIANFFEEMIEVADVKLSANWIMGELSSYLNANDTDIQKSNISAKHLAGLVKNIQDDVISSKIAKEVFAKMWESGVTADEIIEQEGLKQITDTSSIEPIIDEIIANNQPQVEQFKGGNQKILGFFVGQIMKATGGKANPKVINQLLQQKLAN